MSLETQRQILEELNVLETAAAQRFRRNPALRAAANISSADELLESKAKRPHLETISQQHELEFFQKQCTLDTERCRSLFASDALKPNIASLKDPDFKFKHILNTIQTIDDKYHGVSPSSAVSTLASLSMYSSAPKQEGPGSSKTHKVKRKYLLAKTTAHVDSKLKSAFSESEAYGKYVDLSLFHEMYKTKSGSSQTYVEYLQTFPDFKDLKNTPEHVKYLEALLKYLKIFTSNAFPLMSQDSITHISDICQSEDSSQGPTSENDSLKSGEPNANGEVFCKACDKLFTKESVYKGHLEGKKHKKNAQNSHTNVTSGTSAKDTRPSFEIYKSQIRHLASILKPVLENTINDHQRRSRFSDREQELERVALEGDLSDFTTLDSDSAQDNSEDDDDLDDAFSKDLPLGADGIPIPLWLYKLQGLHRTYSCEVCGNISYKGRQQFNKHFTQPKHVHGLMCLGVAESDTMLFANISTIADVQELWAKIQQQKPAEDDNDENNVEVEDDDGNVMSRKDYEELKKQGLI